jgi:hypothetical protein
MFTGVSSLSTVMVISPALALASVPPSSPLSDSAFTATSESVGSSSSSNRMSICSTIISPDSSPYRQHGSGDRWMYASPSSV